MYKYVWMHVYNYVIMFSYSIVTDLDVPAKNKRKQ